MKKMILASCILAAAVFAQEPAKKAAPAPAKVAEPAAAPAPAKNAAPAPAPAKAAEPAPAATPAQAAAPAPAAAPAQTAAPAPVATPAPAATPAPEAKAEPAPAQQSEAQKPAAEPVPAPVEKVEAPVEQAQAQAEPAEPAVEKQAKEMAPAEEVAAAPKTKKKKRVRKQKKMIKNAVMTVNQISFDINADFELEAGKVFWSSEDDVMGDNLETWSGEANFAVLAETDDFKGKIAIAFYPGDLKVTDQDSKIQKKKYLSNENRETPADYFSLDEAWAQQGTDLFTFKVGRWDNTDKSGDYFGGYVDGYLNGFLSTQTPENQLQFGFTPTDNIDFYLSLISGSENLNKGDVRAAFNFHGTDNSSRLKLQLAYRSNLFDVIYDSDSEIEHNMSLKAKFPVNKHFDVFAETAMMNISDDMILPITGGVAFYTPVVDKIILEAEYVKDRADNPDFMNFSSAHVKDVLGAIYLEKSFTSRFSLSAGLHNYGCSRDYMLSGNLVGRIN